MAEAKFKKNHDEENFGATEEQEVDNILNQLSEADQKPVKSQPFKAKTPDVIQKPAGSTDQPENIEGMLEKISEKPISQSQHPVSQPGPKTGFFRKILNFFKKF
jgi:hypothetical protein